MGDTVTAPQVLRGQWIGVPRSSPESPVAPCHGKESSLLQEDPCSKSCT